jgi:hypothetical protein
MFMRLWPKQKSTSDKLAELQIEDRQREQDDAVIISQVKRIFDSGPTYGMWTAASLAQGLDIRIETAHRILETMVSREELKKDIRNNENWYSMPAPLRHFRNRG